MSKPLPPHLCAALGKGHAESDVWRLVTQFELFHHPVRVIRYQLGDMTADGFFEPVEIYHSPEQRLGEEDESSPMAGTHYLPGPSPRP